MKKTNMKLCMELLKMTRASLEDLVYQFTRVTDIRFDNLNVTTAIDGDWATIDELTMYIDEGLLIIGKTATYPDLPVSFAISDIPNGGLIDIILTLESRLK